MNKFLSIFSLIYFIFIIHNITKNQGQSKQVSYIKLFNFFQKLKNYNYFFNVKQTQQNFIVKQIYMNPKIVMMIGKQLQECQKKTPDGVKVIINQSDLTDVQAQIEGPIGTPYEGGIYKCKLAIENYFPNNPPKGYFMTKIFHPNVSEKGEICVNTLKKDWNPAAWSLYNILQVVKCLLIVPFPESALNQYAGKMFMQNYEQYFKHAKLINQLHAQPKQLKVLQNNSKNGKIQPMEQQKPQLKQPVVTKKQNDKKKWMKRI